MTQTTKILGIILIVIGIVGYLASGMASYTALIPAVYGAVFFLLGKFGEDESRRMITMHLAQLLALLAIVGTFTGILDVISWFGGNQEVNMMAAVVRALMALLCIGYLVLGIKSFIDARRASKEV
jgi:hypothetical protein